MANEWIIDVLADLKTYATKNGFSALSRQLEDTTLIAQAEIASAQEKALDSANWDVEKTGRLYRPHAERENA